MFRKKILKTFTLGLISLASINFANAQCGINDPAPFNCNAGDPIDNITINSVSSASQSAGCQSSGTYIANGHSLLSTTWTFTPGFAYNGSINGGGGVWSGQAGLWIDYDGDNMFEPSEFTDIGTGNATSHNFVLNIPSNATPGQKRMRVRWLYAGNVNSTDICNTPGSGLGETEDFNVTILSLGANNVGVTALASPTSSCGGSAEPLSIEVTNYGSNSQSNIPVTAIVTGTIGGNAINQTYNGVIAGPLSQFQSATYNFGNLDFRDGGNISVKLYHGLAVEDFRPNDTLIANYSTVGTPDLATPSNSTRCGAGQAVLSATTVKSYDSVWWYNAATGGSRIAMGKNTLSPPISATTNFWASAVRVGPSSSIVTQNNGGTYVSGNTSLYNGWGFNINPTKTVSINSIQVRFWLNGTANTVRIYKSTGNGFNTVNNTQLWTLHGEYNVVANPGGGWTTITIDPMIVDPGLTGIYIASLGNELYATSGNKTITNADMSLSTGNYVYGLQGSNGTGNGWSMDVTLNYNTICISNRVQMTATVNPVPAGSDFVKGNTYVGTFNSGNTVNPDIVAESDNIEYNIGVPIGQNQSGYGSVWNVHSFTFLSKGGVAVPNSMYTWTPPSSSNSGLLDFTPSNSWTDSTVIAQVRVRFIATGCDTLINRTIFIAPRPNAQFTGTDACEGDYHFFTNSSTVSTGMNSYLWDFGDGNTSTLINPIHRYAAAGTYNVRLYATTNYGYVDSTSFQVTTFELPTASFEFVNACEGTPVQFLNRSTIPSGSATYSWLYGDNTTGAGANTTHLYNTPGIYMARLIVDVNGCKDDVTKYVTQAPRAQVSFTVPSATCDNLGLSFDNNTTIAFGTVGYTWEFGDGNISTNANPMHTYNSFNNFTVKLKASTGFGCIDSASAQVSLIESPKADFSITGNQCSNEALSFNNNTNTPSGSNAYAWEFGSYGTSNDANPTFSFNVPGTYNVKLTAANPNGCFSSKIIPITIGEKPVASFFAENVCEGNDVMFQNGSAGVGTLTYNWDFDNGGAGSTDFNPSVSLTPGDYDVKLTVSNNGCADELIKTVSVFANPTAAPTVTSANSGVGFMQFNSNATGAATYTWYFGNGATSNDENPKYQYPFDGIYNVSLVVESSEGCRNNYSLSANVNRLSINAAGLASLVNVYPNPNAGQFNIDLNIQDKSNVNVKMVNLLGQTVKTFTHDEVNSGSIKVDSSTLAAGIYLIEVVNGNDRASIKVTVTK